MIIMLKLEMPVPYGVMMFTKQRIYYEKKSRMNISKLPVLDRQEKTG